MTLFELVNYLHQGREIEFSIFERSYFMTPVHFEGRSIEKYRIYDNQNLCYIFEGSGQEILEFQFLPNISFKNALSKFTFDYIL